MEIGKYSIGIGNRFGLQGQAQLRAVRKAEEAGVEVVPVWNKSFREHTIVGTQPIDSRIEADEAVRALGWQGSYFVDADHVNLNTVEAFVPVSDFFTLDVADIIGVKAEEDRIASFVESSRKYVGQLSLPGLNETAFPVDKERIRGIAEKYLCAVEEAGRIYRRILEEKAGDLFVTEISLDETAEPQTPVELFFILSMIAREGIPAQTIAPRFSGRFNKGVDYVGDIEQFEREFEQDLAAIRHAVREFSLPPVLKLSVHSGSDKFSLYGPMNRLIRKHDTGLHLKTAGTTWLEELAGLASAGGDGLILAKEIYCLAMNRYEELTGPYLEVLDIDRTALPDPDKVNRWRSGEFVAAMKHDSSDPAYNLHFRQLLHVAYKIAAEMGNRFKALVEKYEDIVGRQVTDNLFERHLKPLFIDPKRV